MRNAQVASTGEVKSKLLGPVKRYKGKTEYAQMGWFLQRPFMPADYAVYVRRPMDLGAVAARLERGSPLAGGYSTYGEVLGDVRLVFANAVKYNSHHLDDDGRCALSVPPDACLSDFCLPVCAASPI